MIITKVFRFEAAHQLPEHDGKCRNLHGHSYKMEVSLKGSITEDGPKTGMVYDFSDLGSLVKTLVIDKWDHHFLSAGGEPAAQAPDLLIARIRGKTTTAENLCAAAWNILSGIFPGDVILHSISIWETDTSYATIGLNE